VTEGTLSFTGMLMWLIISLHSWEGLDTDIEPTL
jgi:hypothetical protein